MDSMNHNTHHEGIRTVKVNKVCDFSGNSDLCICAVTWNMNGKVKFPTPEKKWLCCSLSLSHTHTHTHTHTNTHTHTHTRCLLTFVINMLVDNSPWSIRIALGGLWRLGGAGWEQLQVWSTGGRFARGASEKHRAVIGNSTCGYSCVSQPPSFSFFSANQ